MGESQRVGVGRLSGCNYDSEKAAASAPEVERIHRQTETAPARLCDSQGEGWRRVSAQPLRVRAGGTRCVPSWINPCWVFFRRKRMNEALFFISFPSCRGKLHFTVL